MLRFKKREYYSYYWEYIVLIISLFVSLIIGGIIFLINGINPLGAFSAIITSVFGSFYGFTETMLFSIPIIFCAFASALPANMRLWNIGGEGQFVLGAFGATLIALNLPTLPFIFLIPLIFLSGIFFAMIFGLIAGLLKAILNVNEILVTLMLNYIAILWVMFLVYGPWKGKDNFPYTRYFPESIFLPTIFNSRLHIGIFIAIIIAIILYLMVKESIWGYEIRVVGESQKSARYAGISVKRNIILVMMIAGGLAGLGGTIEVMGLQHRLQPSISQGYGFTGIIVATLAKNNFLYILLASFLISGLLIGGQEMQMFYKTPASIVKMFQGIILLCVLGGNIFIENRLIYEK